MVIVHQCSLFNLELIGNHCFLILIVTSLRYLFEPIQYWSLLDSVVLPLAKDVKLLQSVLTPVSKLESEETLLMLHQSGRILPRNSLKAYLWKLYQGNTGKREKVNSQEWSVKDGFLSQNCTVRKWSWYLMIKFGSAFLCSWLSSFYFFHFAVILRYNPVICKHGQRILCIVQNALKEDLNVDFRKNVCIEMLIRHWNRLSEVGG